MKKLFSKWMVMVVASAIVSVFTINTSNAQGRVSLQVFYDELDPHGTWMEHRTYGYVWIPSVDRDFVPYSSNGYWVQTEYGNTWVSDYSWGWAPFHYGRWFYDDFYGWIWVPDSEWAPAWVTWRSGGGYYGWAPLMPGLNVTVSANYYNTIPSNYWCFVPHRYILHRQAYRYYVPRPRVVNVYRETTIVVHNYNYGRRSTFFTGPSRREIESTNRERVQVYSISDRGRPGRTDIERGRVNVYRPEVDNSRESRSRSVPSRIARDERNGGGTENRFERREVPTERRTTDLNRQRENADRMDQRRTEEVIRRAPQNDREINNKSDERQNPAERQNSVQREQRQQEVQRVPRSQPVERRQEVIREKEVIRSAPQRQPREQQIERSNSRKPAQEVQRVPANRNMPRSVQPRKQPARSDARGNDKRRN